MGGTWHRWTEEEIEIVVRDYAHTHESRRRIAEKLGVTEFAVAGIIAMKGIAKRDDRRRWTPQEKVRLAELVPTYSPRKVAKIMKRSINSVVVMSKRIGVSRRARNGWFTKREVCEILGMDHKWVQRRIDSGALKASYHYDHRPSQLGGSAWHIDEAHLKEFIRRYPEELTARNLDFIMVVEILAGVINGQMGNHKERQVKENGVQCEGGRNCQNTGDEYRQHS